MRIKDIDTEIDKIVCSLGVAFDKVRNAETFEEFEGIDEDIDGITDELQWLRSEINSILSNIEHAIRKVDDLI